MVHRFILESRWHDNEDKFLACGPSLSVIQKKRKSWRDFSLPKNHLGKVGLGGLPLSASTWIRRWLTNSPWLTHIYHRHSTPELLSMQRAQDIHRLWSSVQWWCWPFQLNLWSQGTVSPQFTTKSGKSIHHPFDWRRQGTSTLNVCDLPMTFVAAPPLLTLQK